MRAFRYTIGKPPVNPGAISLDPIVDRAGLDPEAIDDVIKGFLTATYTAILARLVR